MSNTFPKMSEIEWARLHIDRRIKQVQFEIEKSHGREDMYGKSKDEDSLRVMLHGQITGLRDALELLD